MDMQLRRLRRGNCLVSAVTSEWSTTSLDLECSKKLETRTHTADSTVKGSAEMPTTGTGSKDRKK